MATTPMNRVIQHLVAAAGRDGGGMTDGQVLTRFLSGRDEDALAALVERHAPMVWGVCRRLLRHPHDAEDAFQATFLVLVQKAATLPNRETVGNWLHGVARQTAVRMRAFAAKRGGREKQVAVMPEPTTAEQYVWNDLTSVLDEELSRLPNKYRVLIVLCDLEGVTRKEVALRLDIPEGTAASRLAAARAMLAKRLARRGVVMSGVLLGDVLSQQSACANVPASVVTSAINMATLLAAGKAAGVISGPVATLTQGVLKAMFLKKILTTAMAVLALGVAVITGGSLAVGQTDGKPAVGKEAKAPVAEKSMEPAAKGDQEKEPYTAWGKEVNGLQAGLGFKAGEKRAYQIGETVAVVLRVRNVGKEEVKFSYYREEFRENPPAVTDDGGRPVSLERVVFGGLPERIDVKLAPGKMVDLCTMDLVLLPASERGKEIADSEQPDIYKPVWTLFGTGKFQLSYNKSGGGIIDLKTRPDPILSKLATGKLELEVKEPEKEAFTAWGVEQPGGIQIGLGYLPGESRVYRTGESVTLVVRARKVGTGEVTLGYARDRWMNYPPAVIPDGGKKYAKPEVITDILHFPSQVTLKDGREAELYRTKLELRPAGETDDKREMKVFGTGKFHIQVEFGLPESGLIGKPSVGDNLVAATDRKIPSGVLELDVKEPEQLPPKKQAITAWGKAVGGLQAGLELPAGAKRAYHLGETATFVVRVRNAGDGPVEMRHLAVEATARVGPSVLDARGTRPPVSGRPTGGGGGRAVNKLALAVGQEVEFALPELVFGPVGESRVQEKVTVQGGAGKYRMSFHVYCVNPDETGNYFTTGELELEVTDKPPEGEAKPKDTPTGLKAGARKVYTPDELMREKYDSKTTRTVAFKVVALGKPTEVKQSPGKDSPWVIGHSPDDVSLLPQPPKKFEEEQFTAILSSKVVDQLKRVGIKDVGKHFEGKTVRLSGRIRQHNYSGDDPPVGPHYHLVVEDVSQIEAVE